VLPTITRGSFDGRATQEAFVLEREGVRLPHEIDWPKAVDLVMTPNFDRAYQQSSVKEIVGGEFVFRGVPVVMRDTLDHWSHDSESAIHAEP
jgi:hypothetical protein